MAAEAGFKALLPPLLLEHLSRPRGKSLKLTAGAVLGEQQLGFELVLGARDLLRVHIVGQLGDGAHDRPGRLVDGHVLVRLQKYMHTICISLLGGGGLGLVGGGVGWGLRCPGRLVNGDLPVNLQRPSSRVV